MLWSIAKIKGSEAIQLFGKLVVYKNCPCGFANLFLICKIRRFDEVNSKVLYSSKVFWSPVTENPTQTDLSRKRKLLAHVIAKSGGTGFRHGWIQELRLCIWEALSLHFQPLLFSLLLHSQAGSHFVDTQSSMHILYPISKTGRKSFCPPQPSQWKS